MKYNKVPIHTPTIKLDSFLKLAGESGSGGQAKVLILNGEVLLNGEPCLERGKKLAPGDRVEIGGQGYEVSAGEG